MDTLGTRFYGLIQKHNAPTYVKEASLKDVLPDETSASFFESLADPVRKRYPCHTKEASWVSAAAYLEDRPTVPEALRPMIEQNLEKYASFWGILPDIQSLANKPVFRKAATVEKPCYAIDQVINGQRIQKGLIRNKKELCKAASWLVQNRNQVPLDVCAGIASNIIKQADALRVSLPEERRLEQMMGLGSHTTAEIAKGLRERQHLTAARNKEASAQLAKLADSFEQAPFAPGSEEMFKTACAVDLFDQHCGLTEMRNRGEIPFPEELCYLCTASDFKKFASDNVKLQNGNVYSLTDLSGLPRLEFESRMGKDLAGELYTDLEFNQEAAKGILPTLPRPQADALTGFLQSHKVSPIAEESASSEIKIPDECY